MTKGHAVAQLVKALRYKPEGRGFDSRWCHNPSGRIMALMSNQPLTEMSTRNISWGKGGRCIELTTLPPSCADFPEIWEPQPPGTIRASPSLYRDCFTFTKKTNPLTLHLKQKTTVLVFLIVSPCILIRTKLFCQQMHFLLKTQNATVYT